MWRNLKLKKTFTFGQLWAVLSDPRYGRKSKLFSIFRFGPIVFDWQLFRGYSCRMFGEIQILRKYPRLGHFLGKIGSRRRNKEEEEEETRNRKGEKHLRKKKMEREGTGEEEGDGKPSRSKCEALLRATCGSDINHNRAFKKIPEASIFVLFLCCLSF